MTTTPKKFTIPSEKFETVLGIFARGSGFSEFENQEIGSAHAISVGAPSDTSPSWRYRHARHLSTADITVETVETVETISGRVKQHWTGFVLMHSKARDKRLQKLRDQNPGEKFDVDWAYDGYGLATVKIVRVVEYSWGEYLRRYVTENLKNCETTPERTG